MMKAVCRRKATIVCGGKCKVSGVAAYERIAVPTVKKLYVYIKRNLQYPESLQKKKIHGYVTIAFTVRNNETAQYARILRSLHPAMTLRP